MKPFKIYDRVYQIGGLQITVPEDCCVYLLNGGSKLAMIDYGVGRSAPRLIGNIAKLLSL